MLINACEFLVENSLRVHSPAKCTQNPKKSLESLQIGSSSGFIDREYLHTRCLSVFANGYAFEQVLKHVKQREG